MKLEKKVAIVTGGGRGIGRGIALALAREGARVIVNYVTHDKVAKEVVGKIIRKGGEAIAIKTDVADGSDVNRMVRETVDEFGRIDILVNNAGVALFKPFLEVTEEIFDRTFDVDVKGVFFCSQAVAREMIKKKIEGRIINITSISGEVGSIDLAHYCGAKGAANMLTRSIALELAPYKINVNAVGPGVVVTDVNRHMVTKPDVYKHITGNVPLRRYGTPEDIAGAVVYLASDEASYVTGQVIFVDGGCLSRACY